MLSWEEYSQYMLSGSWYSLKCGRDAVSEVFVEVQNGILVLVLISGFDRSIWHCQDRDFHNDLQVRLSKKKVSKPAVKFPQRPWGFSMARGRGLFLRQGQNQMQSRKASATSEAEWLWQYHEIALWQKVRQMVYDCPCTTYGPALCCEHSWTDCEVLQGLNAPDLLITAPRK